MGVSQTNKPDAGVISPLVDAQVRDPEIRLKGSRNKGRSEQGERLPDNQSECQLRSFLDLRVL
jgi:hypothetical protein